MTKRTFLSKVALVREYLTLVQSFRKVTLKDLQNNVAMRLAVERALFLVSQASIDLAESYISLKKYRQPTSMHECFHVLHEQGIIDKNLCNRMLQMVGFRNILTHGYSAIDYKIVLEVLKSRVSDIKRLVEKLGK